MRSAFYAVRTLGWTEEQFGTYTIWEFNLIVEGRIMATRQQHEFTAAMVVEVVNHMPSFSKRARKALKMEDLIGMAPAKRKALLRKARQKMREYQMAQEESSE